MKHIIRAFALGLATATALLTFTYYQTNGQEDPTSFTEQEAIQHLKEKDYHVLTQSAFKSLKQDKSKKETAKETTQETQQAHEGSTEQNNESRTYDLTIKPGMLSSAISQELAQAGLIDKPDDFEIFLKDHEYSRSIQIGTYTIEEGMTFEEIANEITGS